MPLVLPLSTSLPALHLIWGKPFIPVMHHSNPVLTYVGPAMDLPYCIIASVCIAKTHFTTGELCS